MKKPVSLLACILLLAGCTNREVIDRIASDDYRHEVDTVTYPRLIDGGSKIVYQFGRMTADKGLKLYYDTIPAPEKAPPDDLLKYLK